MNFDWNDEATGELKRLFDEGYSMSQIAADLRGTFGHDFSRNAVIGKLHRNKMYRGHPPRKAPAPRKRPTVHRAKAWKPKKPAPVPYYEPSEPEPTAPEAIPMPQRCTLLELENCSCRWPIGEGADMLFCGSPDADLHNGQPYCPIHERMAYAPRTTTRRPFIPMRKAG